MPEDDYLKGKLKKFIPMLLVGLGVWALVLGLKLWLFPTSQRISESTVEVAEIEESGKGVWFVPKKSFSLIMARALTRNRGQSYTLDKNRHHSRV